MATADPFQESPIGVTDVAVLGTRPSSAGAGLSLCSQKPLSITMRDRTLLSFRSLSYLQFGEILENLPSL